MSGSARVGRSERAATARVMPPPWLTPVTARRRVVDLLALGEEFQRAQGVGVEVAVVVRARVADALGHPAVVVAFGVGGGVLRLAVLAAAVHGQDADALGGQGEHVERAGAAAAVAVVDADAGEVAARLRDGRTSRRCDHPAACRRRRGSRRSGRRSSRGPWCGRSYGISSALTACLRPRRSSIPRRIRNRPRGRARACTAGAARAACRWTAWRSSVEAAIPSASGRSVAAVVLFSHHADPRGTARRPRAPDRHRRDDRVGGVPARRARARGWR